MIVTIVPIVSIVAIVSIVSIVTIVLGMAIGTIVPIVVGTLRRVPYPSLPKEAGSCLRITRAAMMPGMVQRQTKAKKWVYPSQSLM